MLHWTRRFLDWRKRQPALLSGDLTLMTDTGDMLCWLRRCSEQTLLVALNLRGRRVSSRLRHRVGKILNGHGFTGSVSAPEIVLPPYQALFATVEDGEGR